MKPTLSKNTDLIKSPSVTSWNLIILLLLWITSLTCKAVEDLDHTSALQHMESFPNKLHQEKATQGLISSPVSKAVSTAFEEEIQRNFNLLLNAKLLENDDGIESSEYFQRKTKKQLIYISPIVGFIYKLTPRLSFSAETELGHFKLNADKWYDFTYQEPKEVLEDSSSIFFHTDAVIRFHF